MSDFLSLGISKNVSDLLKVNGIVSPTPIQERAIPEVMAGHDVIAQAQTGTGKTFTFVLPILEKINSNLEHVQALIVTPTRELALQITHEIENFLEHIEDIRVLAVYGGQDVEKQLKKLKKNVQIVVGTPGRLLDHIRRETVQLSKVSFLVLDEADQMLHIGFLREVEEIINETPATRQTMLFSATISDEIRKLARSHMKNPKNIQVEKTQTPAMTVNQVAIHTTDRGKQALLMQLIETHRPFLALIFCRTKRRVSNLFDALRANGFQCDELHGDLSQAKRERVMERFRKAEMQLLIATDVAARGLDVEGVTHVYNYDIPQDTESYIHRIGRTGRAGSTGLAITLYAEKDYQALESIERDLNITIKKQDSEGGSAKEPQQTDSRQNRQRKPSENRNGRQDRRGRLGENRRANQGSREKTNENRRPRQDRAGRPEEARGQRKDRAERPGEPRGQRQDRVGRPGETRGQRQDSVGRPEETRGQRQDRVGRPGESRGQRQDRAGRPGESSRAIQVRPGKMVENRGSFASKERPQRPDGNRSDPSKKPTESHNPRQVRTGRSSDEWSSSTSSRSNGNSGPKRGSFGAGKSKKRR